MKRPKLYGSVALLVSICLLLPIAGDAADRKIQPRKASKSTAGSQILSNSRGQNSGLNSGLNSGDLETPLNPRFKEVKRLADEQKFTEALAVATKILSEARGENNERLITEALIQMTQLQIGLHGYETAVRTLRSEVWPKGETEQVLLDLYYGAALLTYQSTNSYEITRREKSGEVAATDLREWTREQIGGEILRAFSEALKFESVLSKPAPDFYKPFLVKNTYPAAIRPTLRDAVVYLAVDQLANSGFWSAAQMNGVYQLTIASLAKGEAPARASLTDTSVHPLVRIAALLRDHRAFHASRPQAALEARYELLRRLHAAVSGARDHELVREALESLQKETTQLEWWSVGQSMLSGFYQTAAERADALVVALQAAKLGSDKYPNSYGAQVCNFLQDQILRPSLSMSAMNADAAGKPSVQIRYKHLNKVYFRAYAWDLTGRIAKYPNQDFWNPDGPQGTEDLLAGKYGAPVANWNQDLESTTDHFEHKSFVTPPMRKPGAYLIVASVRADFLRGQNFRAVGRTVVTDMVLERVEQTGGTLEMRALRGETGEPIAGVMISNYSFSYSAPPKLIASRKTDAEGRVSFLFSEVPKNSGSLFQLALRDDGPNLQIAINEQGVYLSGPSRENAKYMDAFLFTDRSVFRPEQKVQWKTLLYSGDGREGKFETAARVEAEVVLVDANSEDVAKQNVTTNEFGSASGEFLIPAGRALGEWRLETRLRGKSLAQTKADRWRGFSRASFVVEEFKRPTFEASFPESSQALRLNQKASLKGEARYYFGLPVASGKVSWKVTKTPVFPWWSWSWRRGFSAAAPEVVAAGNSAVKPDGQFSVEFTPQADERENVKNPGLSFRFDIEASITDEGGETRQATKTVQLGFVSRTAEIQTDVGFYRENAAIEIPVRLTNLNGEGLKGQGHWRLLKVRQPDQTLAPSEMPPDSPDSPRLIQTHGDKKRARWETDFTTQAVSAGWTADGEVAGGELQHDAKGNSAAIIKSGLAGGVYRLIYESKDDFGASFKVSRDITVVGKSSTFAQPLLVLSEKTAYEVGEVARVFVNSGFAEQKITVDIYRANQLLKRQVINSRALIEIPVSASDRGGFTISVRTLRDFQYLQTSANIMVPWTNQELSLKFATFRDRIHPGAKESVRVTIASKDGSQLSAKAAEVLTYMYDRSLDLFRVHAPVSPLAIFPSRLGTPQAVFSLGYSDAALTQTSSRESRSYAQVQMDQLRFPNSYGIGGPGRRGGFGRGGGIGFGNTGMITNMAMKSKSSRSMEAEGFAVSDAAPMAAAAVAVAAPVSAAPQVALRSNFSETAFWIPQLLTDANGSVAFEYTVPDSLSSWNLWVHALTKDLRSGQLKGEARSVKDLMVRPYLPRFLRESDEADVRVSVSNASSQIVSGELQLEILDSETGKSAANEFGLKSADVKRAFKAPAGGSDTLTFKMTAPRLVRAYEFKMMAVSKEFSDGEKRLLPVLPSRLHLAQSRFVTLKNADTKTMEFKDLAANSDKTLINDRVVVSVDAQLFYGVLKALPYLITYPYECTEQTLNRFLSTGIVSSVFKKYPAVEKMARTFAARETPLEKFDGADANQRMTFEETPWLQDAKGGDPKGMVNALDPKLAAAERDRSLARLKKMQLASGGFPWFEGGRENEYMTLYLLIGFARAREFQIDVPKDVVVKSWQYLGGWMHTTLRECMGHDGCESLVTMLGFALSSYPDPSWTAGVFTDADKKDLLNFSFKHWKSHSPLLKGYLALTLSRAKRADDAKLVWSSVMDSAKSTPELGTYWAPEERSWLWYNDTIETQAFALRTQMELAPADSKNEGLVQWLFLNKKLNHWKSTRATAESIYALVHYLDQTKTLAQREEVTVETNGQKKSFVFEPDAYTGAKNQLVIEGKDVVPATASKVVVKKTGGGFAFASSTWHFSTEQLPTEGQGDFFSVGRRYFKRELQGASYILKPLKDGDTVKVGDQVEVQLSLKTKHEAEYVHLRDPRGSGFEPESQTSGYNYDLGLASYQEVRDSGANFFFNWLPVGEYTFKYRVRANMAGVFRVGPATVQSLYAPEFNAYSAGHNLKVEP